MSRILAIIRNTLKKYSFTPGFIFLLILLFLIPFWTYHLKGDGTIEGKFKVFITYSFLIASLILTVVNISISCIAISSEWKKKTLLLLDTKPIRRWEIISGKWLGISILNIFLISAFLVSFFLSSILFSHNTGKNLSSGKNIFLTYAQISPFSHKGKAKKNLSSFLTPPELISPSTSSKKKETYAIPPGGKFKWDFKGIKNVSSDIYLVFRLYTSQKKIKKVVCYWLAGNSGLEKPFELNTEFSPNKTHRLLIPREAISKNGDLSLTFLNIDPRNISILFPKKDMKILYPSGNYWSNLLRGATNLFFIGGFISGIGIFFSTLVSTLTSVLSTSILVFLSYLHDFVGIITKSLLQTLKTKGGGIIPHLSYPLLKLIISILPPINKALPHSYIGDSLMLPLSYLGYIFLRVIILGALPFLLISMLYISHRELGIPNE